MFLLCDSFVWILLQFPWEVSDAEPDFTEMYENDFAVALISPQWCQEQALPYCWPDDGFHQLEAARSTPERDPVPSSQTRTGSGADWEIRAQQQPGKERSVHFTLLLHFQHSETLTQLSCMLQQSLVPNPAAVPDILWCILNVLGWCQEQGWGCSPCWLCRVWDWHKSCCGMWPSAEAWLSRWLVSSIRNGKLKGKNQGQWNSERGNSVI